MCVWGRVIKNWCHAVWRSVLEGSSGKVMCKATNFYQHSHFATIKIQCTKLSYLGRFAIQAKIQYCTVEIQMHFFQYFSD